MIIYNVTTQVDPQIEQEWLQWMREIYLSEVFQCGAFEAINLLKIHSDALESLSYAIQYVAASKQILQAYVNQWENAHIAKEKERFGEQTLRFQTELEIVHSIS